MLGMDAKTGKSLSGHAHLWQSIRTILLTPLGTRVYLREFGSDLLKLIDNPLNRSTIANIINATAGAIARWEPRIRVTNVRILSIGAGAVELDIEGIIIATGEQANFLITND